MKSLHEFRICTVECDTSYVGDHVTNFFTIVYSRKHFASKFPSMIFPMKCIIEIFNERKHCKRLWNLRVFLAQVSIKLRRLWACIDSGCLRINVFNVRDLPYSKLIFINLQYFIDWKRFSSNLCNAFWGMAVDVLCRNIQEIVPFKLIIFCFNYFHAYLKQFSIFTMWNKIRLLHQFRAFRAHLAWGFLDSFEFGCRSCYQLINGEHFVAALGVVCAMEEMLDDKKFGWLN